jgi:transposase-like protein
MAVKRRQFSRDFKIQVVREVEDRVGLSQASHQ